jgi:hypothetical protein
MTADSLPVGRGSEAQVQAVFERWLVAAGWQIVHERASWMDVHARRGEETLIAEVKGRTGVNTGLDVDTMYGQLLRRMTAERDTVQWAVVVPTAGVKAALRVGLPVRRVLGIRVFEVTDHGQVIEHDEP